jgi:hypothetical protein
MTNCKLIKCKVLLYQVQFVLGFVRTRVCCAVVLYKYDVRMDIVRHRIDGEVTQATAQFDVSSCSPSQLSGCWMYKPEAIAQCFH